MFKNTASQKLTCLAFADAGHATLDAGDRVTGDAANITCKVEQDDDGTQSATNDVNPTEVEDGQYRFDLTQAETNGDKLTFYPESATAGVQVIALPSHVIYTRPPNFADIGIESDGHVHGDVKEWLGVAPLALSSQRVQSHLGAGDTNVLTASLLATDAVNEIRNAVTGGAFSLDTDANGRIRIVDGTGAGELNTSGGFIAGIAGTKNTLDDLNDIDGNSVNLADGAHGGVSAVLTLERIVVASTTANEPAVKLTGNGSQPGLRAIGGATGHGIEGVGGGTSGAGILGRPSTATIIYGAGESDGIVGLGTGARHGLHLEGGDSGLSLNAPDDITTPAINLTTPIESNMLQISNDSGAADALERAYEGMLLGAVDTATFTATTTVFETSGLTDAGDDTLIGQRVRFGAGAAHAGKSFLILDSQGTTANANNKVKLTVQGMPSAPGNGDVFAILPAVNVKVDAANELPSTNADAISESTTAADNVEANIGNLDAAVTTRATPAQVNTEVDTAMQDIHLDHIFAADYDPANPPGVATAWANELVESDAGVTRLTANALEQTWSAATRTLTALGFNLGSSDFAAGAIDANALATDAVNEIRDAITGFAGSLDTDANGRIRVVDGAGAGEINTAAGAVVQVDQLGTQAKADVNAEAADVLTTDTRAEPGQGTPAATLPIATKIDYLFKAWRNKSDQDASTYQLYNDDTTTVDQKATVSEAAGLVTRGEVATGP